MKKKPETQVRVAMKCFTVRVDGKSYGPFLDKFRKKVLYLEHKVGIDIDTSWIKEGWIPFKKESAPPLKRDKTTPLLDGLGFTPVSKQLKDREVWL